MALVAYNILTQERKRQLTDAIAKRIKGILGDLAEVATLVEYICMMLQSGKARDVMEMELAPYLHANARQFMDWLVEWLHDVSQGSKDSKGDRTREPANDQQDKANIRKASKGKKVEEIQSAEKAAVSKAGASSKDEHVGRVKPAKINVRQSKPCSKAGDVAEMPAKAAVRKAGFAVNLLKRTLQEVRAAQAETRSKPTPKITVTSNGRRVRLSTAPAKETPPQRTSLQSEKNVRQKVSPRKKKVTDDDRDSRSVASSSSQSSDSESSSVPARKKGRVSSEQAGSKVALKPQQAPAVQSQAGAGVFASPVSTAAHTTVTLTPRPGTVSVTPPPGNFSLAPRPRAGLSSGCNMPGYFQGAPMPPGWPPQPRGPPQAPSPKFGMAEVPPSIHGAPPHVQAVPETPALQSQAIVASSTPALLATGPPPRPKNYQPQKWRTIREDVVVRATHQLDSASIRALQVGEIVESVAPPFALGNGVVRLQVTHHSSELYPNPIGWVTLDATAAGGPRFFEPGPSPVHASVKKVRPYASSMRPAGEAAPWQYHPRPGTFARGSWRPGHSQANMHSMSPRPRGWRGPGVRFANISWRPS